MVWHAFWASTIPQPVDWDPAYYLDVATNIAEGRGAVSGAVWQLAGLPETLPQPADLHWMPVPSRVLVPFVWLAGGSGASAMTVLLMAGWVPIAAQLARVLGASRAATCGAGFLAAMAGGYVRFGSTPDSIAVFGVVAGLAWLSAARGRAVHTAVWVLLAAWTRGDGFVLAPAVGLVLWGVGRWRAGMGVAGIGPLGFAIWMGRSWIVGGEAWWAARLASGRAVHIHDLQLGRVVEPTVLQRLQGVLDGFQGAVSTALLVGVVFLPFLAVAGVWMRRHHPLVKGAGVYALSVVVLTHGLAPGVAASGSIFRCGAAVFPMFCALGAVAAVRLGVLGHHHRGYPRRLVPLVLAGGFAIGSGAIGVGTWTARPGPGVDCLTQGVEDAAPVFSGRPLLVRSTCGRSSVALYRTEAPDAVKRRAQRYGIQEAWLPDTDPDPMVATRADAAALLPDWQERAPGVWVRPDTPSSTTAD
ncbi:MAG: hypothetical protein CL927_09990 [Deltaproteobacteria bacterium]|nr:hypothetical protein [Deltaproteobacteria bacterium]